MPSKSQMLYIMSDGHLMVAQLATWTSNWSKLINTDFCNSKLSFMYGDMLAFKIVIIMLLMNNFLSQFAKIGKLADGPIRGGKEQLRKSQYNDILIAWYQT